MWPQDRTTDIQQLVEARYHHHHHQTHDLDDAFALTYRICAQLHTWGAWTWEEDLYTETLTWLSPRSSATSKEELGNRAGIAASYHQLGMIAELRGEYAQAEQRYQASLAIAEELGDRAGIAASYHQLGVIAELRGEYAQAEQRYQASLAISEELGNRADIAATTSQLGALRTQQGRPVEGIPYNISALVIRRELEFPEASKDVFWLSRQQQEIGEVNFTETLSNLLDADSIRLVIDILNRFENEGDPH